MPRTHLLPPAVLAFAATDPAGVYGLQADVMVFAESGCYPLGVVTGLGVGDTSGLDELLAVDAMLVHQQARTLLEDIPVAALKIGQVSSVENVCVIAEVVADYPDLPIVLVPEPGPRSADAGDDDLLMTAISEMLLPFASLVVIGQHGARLLLGTDAEGADPGAVSIGGLREGAGHLLLLGEDVQGGQVLDTLIGESGIVRSDVRPASCVARGRAAMLGSAITAGLARALPLSEAVARAQQYVNSACRTPMRIGMGAAVPRRSRPESHPGD